MSGQIEMSNDYKIGDVMEGIKLLPDDYLVKYRSEEIQLLRKEFQLFECLFRDPSRLYTRAELLEMVWMQEEPTDRTVDDHIYRVRKKLKPIDLFSNVIFVVYLYTNNIYFSNSPLSFNLF